MNRESEVGQIREAANKVAPRVFGIGAVVLGVGLADRLHSSIVYAQTAGCTARTAVTDQFYLDQNGNNRYDAGTDKNLGAAPNRKFLVEASGKSVIVTTNEKGLGTDNNGSSVLSFNGNSTAVDRGKPAMEIVFQDLQNGDKVIIKVACSDGKTVNVMTRTNKETPQGQIVTNKVGNNLEKISGATGEAVPAQGPAVSPGSKTAVGKVSAAAPDETGQNKASGIDWGDIAKWVFVAVGGIVGLVAVRAVARRIRR